MNWNKNEAFWEPFFTPVAILEKKGKCGERNLLGTWDIPFTAF
jgi:hypothetical protein